MRTIHKYQFSIDDVKVILVMPAGAIIRKIALQRSIPCLWAEVDPTAPTQEYKFLIFGTGHPIPSQVSYVATFFDGSLVWHVYR